MTGALYMNNLSTRYGRRHMQELDECRRHCLPAYIQVKQDMRTTVASGDPMYVRVSSQSSRPQFPPGLNMHAARYACDGPMNMALPMQGHIQTKPTGRSAEKLIDPSTLVLKIAKKQDSGSKLHIKHPGCVIHVSNMAALGGSSATVLREHYEQYGEVVSVWLSLAPASPGAKHERHRQCGGVALVIMRQKDDANTAIAQGETQKLNGVNVDVRTFNPKADHPRHQKAWYVAESELEVVKSSSESDHGSDDKYASFATDSTADLGAMSYTDLDTSSASDSAEEPETHILPAGLIALERFSC